MGKKLVMLAALIAATTAAGCSGPAQTAPLRHTVTEDLVVNEPFRCEEDMPCFFPEMRTSFSDDIDRCRSYIGYTGFTGCLDEVRAYWTTTHA